jgi:hypothetical protein
MNEPNQPRCARSDHELAGAFPFSLCRIAPAPPLPERRRVTLFTDLTSSLRSIRCLSCSPRIHSPLFGIDGTRRHAFFAALAMVLVLARSYGAICANCSLMTAAIPRLVMPRVVLHVSGRMTALLLLWMTLRRWSPFSRLFIRCANAIRRSPANTRCLIHCKSFVHLSALKLGYLEPRSLSLYSL